MLSLNLQYLKNMREEWGCLLERGACLAYYGLGGGRKLIRAWALFESLVQLDDL